MPILDISAKKEFGLLSNAAFCAGLEVFRPIRWDGYTSSPAPKATPLTKHLPPAEPVPAPQHKHSSKAPMFNGAGEITGEKETAAMLEAVAKATTFDRLLSIDKSRHLGFDTNRLTLDQARTIREAIDKRQAELASTKATKAA